MSPRLPPLTPQRAPGVAALIPFAFVILSLLALALAPLLVDQRIRPLRNEVADVIEPARILTSRVEGLLAQQVSLLRGFLLTRDERMLVRYRQLVEEEHRAQADLRARARGLGPGVREDLADLQALTTRWQLTFQELSRGGITPEEMIEQLPVRQAQFEEALAAAERLDRTLARAESERRLEIQEMLALSRWVTLALVLMAAAAALVVAWMGVRLSRRTRTEEALRRIGHSLTGAATVEEIVHLVAECALRLTGACGVYVEKVVAGEREMEVVSSLGEGSPPSQTRVAYPGSLTQEILTGKESRLLAEVGAIGHSMAPYLGESCRGCSALVVPLRADDVSPLGALVLLRPSSRPRFGREEVALANLLADLASLAARKVLLLEEAERRRAEVEELAETKTKLIRGISHDLKNPIGALDGYAALLEMELKGPLNEEQRGYVTRIRRAGESMLDIIEGLLELARMDTGQLSIERTEAAVGQIACEAADDYRAAAELAGLELRVEIPDDLPPVATDPRRVRAILGNLLSNVIKYTPSGGRATVRAGIRSGGRAPGPGSWLTVDVVDTGPGIPAEAHEKIFQEFQRLEPERARGAGIGLAISRRIARLLGGDLTVRSTPGEGSTFSVWLPLAGENVADSATRARAGMAAEYDGPRIDVGEVSRG